MRPNVKNIRATTLFLTSLLLLGAALITSLFSDALRFNFADASFAVSLTVALYGLLRVADAVERIEARERDRVSGRSPL